MLEIQYNIYNDNAPSWEEVNKINKTPQPIATSFIPNDCLDDTQVSVMLADVETQIPPHLQDMFVRSKKNISIREQDALGILLSRYGNVFSKDNNDLGKFTLIRHRINNYNEDSVRERLRRTWWLFQSLWRSRPKDALALAILLCISSSMHPSLDIVLPR